MLSAVFVKARFAIRVLQPRAGQKVAVDAVCGLDLGCLTHRRVAIRWLSPETLVRWSPTPPSISLASQREAPTEPATSFGRAALPASSRATGTLNGEHDT
jgi:hypothetical protein